MREVFQNSSIAINTPRSQKRTVRTGVNFPQLLIGFSGLVLGILFYYFFRSAEHTYFLKILAINPQGHKFLSPILVALANSLPTFIHVFAFILMTASLIAGQKRGYIAVCLAWFAVDFIFELGQGFGDMLISFIPDWFSNFLFFENTKDYLQHGRFDYLDLISIAIGALTAYLFLIRTTLEKEEGA